MSDQAKFQKMLEVLLMLDCKFGRTIGEIADKFGITTRTVYRYINTFRSVGFVIENKDNYLKINKQESQMVDIGKLLHFSEEESFILSKAINAIEKGSEIRDKLVSKLYSLYDSDRVVHAIMKKEDTENVYALIQAIKYQKQVTLKSYQSGNSSTVEDRHVEPFDFTANYQDVWCFDLKDNLNKRFKTSRIQSVVVQDDSWQHQPLHRAERMDVFRIHSSAMIPIKLEMSMLAANLLTEEFPLASKYLSSVDETTFILSTEVGNFLGVGRFILGLPGEITIIYPQELKSYIIDKMQKMRL